MSEIEEKIDDLSARFDLMQSTMEHLGTKIGYLISASRTGSDAPPPALKDRRAHLMKMLMEE